MTVDDLIASGLAIAGLLAAAVALAHLILEPRRARRRPVAAKPAPAKSAIEEMVLVKAAIREDEASRWVAEWMRIAGETDKWQVFTEIRDRSFKAAQRIREAQFAAARRERELRHEANAKQRADELAASMARRSA